MTDREFVQAVQKMRIAQKRYFELMGIARKRNGPEDFANARKMLQVSKGLEKQVDEAVEQFNAAV